MAAVGKQDKAVLRTIYTGRFIHSKSLEELEYMEDTAVCVDEKGVIVAIEKITSESSDETALKEQLCSKLGWSESDVLTRASGKDNFFFPGFIDTHIHAPQYPNSGIFGKSTLLSWLNTYTFPLESSLSSLPLARRVYATVIRRTLSHGTTTAAYYATISVETTNLLSSLCLSHGQRAFVGRVCMDSAELCPAYYRDESDAAALAATLATVEHIAALDPAFALVSPILTPRFAPACTPELLAALGRLARARALPVQTHLSENHAEIALVRRLFPACASYTAVYDAHGLLTPRTVLAHCVHLSAAERELVRARGCGVAHCPASNSSITSGTAKVRWLLRAGVSVGLGTDVSGGYAPSVLEAARQALLVSRHVAMRETAHQAAGARGERDDTSKLSVEECLYLATRGGAKVLGLEARVGGFEVGMEWDALLVGLDAVEEQGVGEEGLASRGPVDIFGWESWEDRIAKWLFCGDDRNMLAVWVKGRLVHKR